MCDSPKRVQEQNKTYRYCAPRVVLVGDAAHRVHPLAGQGLNIGLMDVEALGKSLVRGAECGQDLGSSELLKDYEKVGGYLFANRI